MIESNRIVKDHQIMYKWLRSICDDVIKREVNLIDQQDLVTLFSQKMVDPSLTFVENLSLEGYFCI